MVRRCAPPSDMAGEIQRRLDFEATGQWRAFSMVDCASGRASGMTSYMNLVPSARCLEIGGTWYRCSAQRSGINAECKRLLLSHAFERLNCTAAELRTSSFNQQNRARSRG